MSAAHPSKTQGSDSLGGAPVDLGTVVSAIFDDTCGNLIQIVTPALVV